MIDAKPSSEPYDSAHHTETSLGDTFGGLGVCTEVCEEDVRARLQRGKRQFLDHGPSSAAPIPRSRDTDAMATWERWKRELRSDWYREWRRTITHDPAHDSE